jgi:ribosomal protein L30E
MHVSAQGDMRFEVETYDFGTITEGTIAEYEFVFTNVGNAPVILQNVSASCGCTTPNWTKDPVAPKQIGVIKASYNSNGRPGYFNKSITVTSNAISATKVLFIKGNVVSKTETPVYSEAELDASPVLKLTTTTASLGKVERGQRVLAKFSVQNSGKSELKMVNIESACACVSHRLIPSILKPGENGTLELYYMPRMVGEQKEKVKLLSNDITKSSPEILLQASVVEALSNTSPMKNKNDNPFK